MKTNKGLSQLNRDDRGVSLVEILASLLILMIVAIPLISSFATASKANKVAKDRTYAATAGENVMESVKMLGLEETAKEFYKCGRNPFSVVPSATDYNEIVGGESQSVSEGKFVKHASGNYEFAIRNVSEGTDTYDVKIKISTVGYSGGASGTNLPNDYLYADLAAFDSKSVAIINPVLSGASYNDKALRYFANMNMNYENARFESATRAVDEYNSDRYDEYLAELAHNPAAVQPVSATSPPIANYQPMEDNDVLSNMNKKMTAQIDGIPDADGNMQFVLNSNMIFSCINKNGSFDASKPDGSVIERAPFTGYCKNQHYESLDTLFIVLDTLGDEDNLDNNAVEIIKNTPESLDVFIVLQGSETVDYGTSTTKPKVSIKGSNPSEIHLYSQAELEVDSAVPQTQSLIKDLNDGSDRLYNITVEVYEAGSTFTKLVSHMDSTLIDDK